MARDHVAFLVAGVDSDALPLGPAHVNETTGRWQKARSRILRVDASFDRVKPPLRFRMDVERVALCDAQLLLHKVHAEDHLGDGMLHLKPSIHFEEIEGPVFVHDELHRAGIAIAGLARDRDRRRRHALARGLAQGRRRSLLDDLLVAPLCRAVAISDRYDGAALVGEHLHLDVARPFDEAL